MVELLRDSQSFKTLQNCLGKLAYNIIKNQDINTDKHFWRNFVLIGRKFSWSIACYLPEICTIKVSKFCKASTQIFVNC